ncbi:aminodeoxychorismate lyase [Propionicimonas sp.]|uniref:aminodeoxychorismate lyase n=1 Tax=Propionicimonas sp. TaxID=1955623 RepID=UPI0039E3FD2F
MPACIIVSPAEASAPVPAADRLHVVDPALPQVSVTDLGVTRGDGIFEVLGVVDGHPQAVDAHLRRLAVSAAMLDLPPLDLDAFRAAIHQVVAAYEEPHREYSVKIIVTRGVEGSGVATAWVLAFKSTDDYAAERQTGVSVVLLERGYPHDIASRAPWLLAGAKTLSYAVNKAVLREAARRGAQDVLFTSSDGYVLEGPSASLIVKHGTHIWTPSTSQGILRGTTQAAAFEYFASAGFAPSEVLLRIDQLWDADAMWLTSSGRMLVPVRELDGRPVPIDRALTDAGNAALLARAE